MKKPILTLFFLGFFTSFSFAQYNSAFGLRYNGGLGLSAKFNLKNQNALEGILTGYSNGVNLALLYEKHTFAFDSKQWRWFLGAGGHMGYWTGLSGKKNPRPFRYNLGFNVGLDGILGIEHTFNEIPLNVSIDWKPALNLAPNTSLGIRNIGISGRFVLK